MSQIGAYTDNGITTQSRGGLVVMLYDGAVRFLNQAIAALAAGDEMRTNGTSATHAKADQPTGT